MRRQAGLTLVELMVVVVIIALLAAFGYPAYREQIRNSNRADCTGALTSFGGRMERYYTVNNTYEGAANAGADTGVPAIFSPSCPVDGGQATYNLTIQAAAAATYTLQAAPTGAQAGDRCGTLTLTNTGLKGVTGADAGVTWQDCWR